MQEILTKQMKGFDLAVLPTDQFKMTTVGIQFLVPLSQEQMTSFALLPYVLMRGSERFPSADAIQKELARLYGATLAFGVGKKGNIQLPSFTLKVVNEKFLGQGENVLEQSIRLLCDVLFRPRFVDHQFPTDEITREKEQHRKRIESIFDDKIAFAMERCIEELGQGYAFSLPRYGRVEDLDRITPERLTRDYQDLFHRYPLQMMVVGDVDPARVFEIWEQALPDFKQKNVSFPSLERLETRSESKLIVEEQEIAQGKLNLGYTTGITYEDDLYPQLVVYNSILGGSATSKLFTNVREKASLCYYVGSRLEPFVGAMTIQSGIEVDKFDDARRIIGEQIQDLQNGQMSEDELFFAKQSLINQYRTANDSPDTVIDFYITGRLTGKMRTLQTLMEEVEKVTLDDVISIAQQIQEQTIYFLRSKSNETQAEKRG